MINLPFSDRTEAGRLLGEALATRKFKGGPIVLGLPRGGVPVGREVAEKLQAPLDVVAVRKLGVPWQPELAMGALAGGSRILDDELIEELHLSEEQVEEVVAREKAELQRREKLYRGGRPAPDLHGRSVLLVDDGLATGSTMIAAARHARSLHPAEVIVAVPVAPEQTCHRMKQEADDCVCLATPEPYFAVGQWYADFQQVSDAEVQALLKRSRRAPEPAHS